MNSFEEPGYQQQNLKKVYKNNAIRIGTFLGGPLVGGYLIAENFKAFNQPSKAKITWLVAITFTIVILVAAIYIPAMQNTRYLVPLLYSWAAYHLVQQLQGNNLDQHQANGGEAFSWWRLIGIAILGLVITFAVFFVILMVFQPFLPD